MQSTFGTVSCDILGNWHRDSGKCELFFEHRGEGHRIHYYICILAIGVLCLMKRLVHNAIVNYFEPVR